jgi:hypothetical protein
VSDPAQLLSLLEEVEVLLDGARERRNAAERQGAKAR